MAMVYDLSDIYDRFKNGVGSSRRLQSFSSDWSGYYLLIPKL